MRILILSWRDIKNPTSGGAEIYTFELAKRWTKFGHSITWFSTSFPKAKPEEVVEEIRILRQGNSYTVHLNALLHYRKCLCGKFDVVIDQIHGLPFFTPLYVKEKKVALICEMAKEIWDLEFSFPLNLVGGTSEFLYPYFYRDIPFITISKSTQADLLARGIHNVKVIYPGLTLEIPNTSLPKEPSPTLINLGRITPMKQIEQSIKMFRFLVNKVPDARFWIVGRGEPTYVKKLKNLVEDLNLKHQVRFWGFIPEKKKVELLQRAWILISTSRREGWGLVVIEANACGTPAVTYNAPGLNESILHKKTGLFTNQNTPLELATLLEEVIKNPNFFQILSKNAKAWSKNFSWERAARQSIQFLESI